VELVGVYSNHATTSGRFSELRKRIEESPERAAVRRIRRQKAPRRFSGEEIAELVQGYRDGLTIYELAIQFGIHRQTVSSALEAEGMPRRRRPLSPAQIEKAAGLRENGWSLAQVGAELGGDPSTVCRTLARTDITAPQSERASGNQAPRGQAYGGTVRHA